jgi:hypothetical protein
MSLVSRRALLHTTIRARVAHGGIRERAAFVVHEVVALEARSLDGFLRGHRRWSAAAD